MLFTNVNITNNTDTFKYVLEYIKNDARVEFQMDYLNGMDLCDPLIHIDDILFIHDNIQHVKHFNHWHNIKNVETAIAYTPNISKEGVIRLYFPQFSVDTYRTGHKYAVTISTWICGKHIILGS